MPPVVEDETSIGESLADGYECSSGEYCDEPSTGSHQLKSRMEKLKCKPVPTLPGALANGGDTRISNGTANIGHDEDSSDSEEPEVAFVRRVAELVLKENLLACQNQLDRKVIEFVHPKKLETELLDLSLKKTPASLEDLLKSCELAIKYSVRTSHPNFRNQLYGGVDPYGVGGAWLSEALNTNQYTFEVAPFFIETERAVLQKIRDLVGWSAGDGILSPGGSAGNMYGIVSARYRKFPQTKTEGVYGLPKLALFVSQDAHYSSKKAAHWLGLGTNSVISVDTDEWGRMVPLDLEKKILESKVTGSVPFCVVATSGTTVLGAFDPLEEIATVCKKYDVWMHVDACWGGSVLLSKRHRHLMSGVEKADSVIWNPHKMLGAPLQCSPFVIKHEGLLHRCNSASATYLFQQDKFYDVSYDTGDKSFQCGRKVDAFKLWTMWKARGDDGFENLVDRTFVNSEYAYVKMERRPGFKMVLPSAQCTNVCFWYIPKCLRGMEENDEWWAKVEKVAPEVKRLMTLEGSLLVGYQPLKHKMLRNFFRLTFTCQPPLSKENVDFVIDEIDRLGKDLTFC